MGGDEGGRDGKVLRFSWRAFLAMGFGFVGSLIQQFT